MKRYIKDDISMFVRDTMFNLFLNKVDKNYDGPQVIKTLMSEKDIIDTDNEYHINSLGYRSDEFEKNKAEVVTAGCSISFGMGVPEEGVWSKMISQSTGLSVVNLGIPGNSTLMLVKRIIKYCEEYGDPKTILCLFPDFFRFLFVIDNDFHKTDKIKTNSPINSLKIRNIHSNAIEYGDSSINIPAMLIKTPFSVEENISPYYGVFQSLNSIFFLETYCKAKNIKLVWTTWDNTSSFILDGLVKSAGFELQKYVKIKELENDMSHPNMIVEKCKDHDGDDMIDNKAWPIGTDLPHNNFVHPGIHFHRHIAEFFMSQMEL